MATKYVAKFNGEIVGKRTTANRTYTHAVVVQNNEAKDYADAHNWTPDAQFRRNFEFETAMFNGTHELAARKSWQTAEEYAARRAKEVVSYGADIEGGFDAAAARMKARLIAAHAKRVAEGYYKPQVSGWAGRLDLAQKEAAKNAKWRTVLAIVPAEVVG